MPNVAVPVEDKSKSQLHELEDQLVGRYVHDGHPTEAEVRDRFHTVEQRFARAKVRNYVPILIERAVKAAFA